MKFTRRAASGYYLPQQVSRLEYGYWDGFDRADENDLNGQLGPNDSNLYWQGFGGGSPLFSMKLFSNQLRYTSNLNAPVSRYVSTTPTSDDVILTDSYAQLVYKAQAGGSPKFHAIGLCLRTQGAAGGAAIQNGYYGWVNVDPAVLSWQVGAFFNGGGGGYGTQTAGSGSGLSAFTPGDVIKFTAVGFHPTTLTLYVNGSSIGSATMSGTGLRGSGNYADGAPGIYWAGGSDGVPATTDADSWQAGSIPTSGRKVYTDPRGAGFWFPSISPP